MSLHRRKRPQRRPRAIGGFSLIELLTVVAMIAIVLALSLPAISSTQEGLEITRATDMVTDSLNLARQQAMTLNRPVVVRFYVSTERPDEGYTRLQVFAMEDDGSLQPLSRMQKLPERTALSRLPELGNVFSAAPQTPVPALPSEAGLLASEMLIGRNGSADLPEGTCRFLTIVARNAPLTPNPSNFGIVTIEPLNTSISQLRP